MSKKKHAKPAAPPMALPGGNVLANMTALNLSRLTAALLGRGRLTPAHQRLGDYVMSEATGMPVDS